MHLLHTTKSRRWLIIEVLDAFGIDDPWREVVAEMTAEVQSRYNA